MIYCPTFVTNNNYCDPMYDYTTRVLFALSFRTKLLGTSYLLDALLMCYNYTGDKLQLSTVVYPQVAKRHNSTPERIERAIRNSIHDCHSNGKLTKLNDVFRSNVIDDDYPPSNGDFIALVVNIIRHFNNTNEQDKLLYKLADKR